MTAACSRRNARHDDIATTAWLAHCHATLASRMLAIEIKEECQGLLFRPSSAPHPDELLLANVAYDRVTENLRLWSALRGDAASAIRTFLRGCTEILPLFREPWSKHWQQYWILEGRQFYSVCMKWQPLHEAPASSSSAPYLQETPGRCSERRDGPAIEKTGA